MDESLDSWFKREVLVHEEILMSFLARVWPRRHEIEDLRHDAYERVYEAAMRSRPTAPKAFLFATVRHLMADRIRRERIVSIQAAADTSYLNALVDEISPEQRVGANQELARLARAFDRLPAKYREVLWQRRVNGYSQKEVAQQLNIKERGVEKRLAVAARLLAQFMYCAARVPRVARRRKGEGPTDEREVIP